MAGEQRQRCPINARRLSSALRRRNHGIPAIKPTGAAPSPAHSAGPRSDQKSLSSAAAASFPNSLGNAAPGSCPPTARSLIP